MPLTHEQAIELCSQIESRRAVLAEGLRKDLGQSRVDNLAELAGPAPDPGDESVAREIVEMDHAEASRDMGELRQLDEARRRFDEGTYGVCTDCGRDIDYRRLRANPAAIRCIDCQSRYEKTFASGARPTL